MTPAPTRHSPERTCVGCRSRGEPSDLVRVVRGPEGELHVDLAGGTFGRGAWLHARPECVGRAAPRGLAASFRAPVSTSAPELWSLLREAADRRTPELIGIARRAGMLAVGSAAVEEALRSDRAALVIVACDARAAAETGPVEAAIAAGRAAAWGSKSRLGAALGRGDVGVVAVLDDGLARSLSSALAVASMPEPRAGRKTSGLTEVS
jgi:predicted RNA-binding protein YlxR (DUF448 family)